MAADDEALIGWARSLAAAHLARQLPARWSHVQGVARRAGEVAPALDPEDAAVLVAAAWLHDVGYAPELRRTGAHQLDGGALLRGLGEERLAALVAHHSESRFELALMGLEGQLDAYADEDSPVSEGLTYCDLTTSPTGTPVDPEERLTEIRGRYGDGHVYVRAQRVALPHLLGAVTATRRRLGCDAGRPW